MSPGTRSEHAEGAANGQPRHAVVLVNDFAPHARDLNWVQACSRAFGPAVQVSEVRVTGLDAVREAAAKAAHAGAWLVISVGGDGTARAVIDGVGAHPTRICVMPGGTENNLAYQMGYSTNLMANINSLPDFEPIEIDAMRVNGIRFASFASCGWTPDGMHIFNKVRAKGEFWRRLSRPFGSLMYYFIFLWLLRDLDVIGGPIHVSCIDEKDNSEKTVEMDVHTFVITGSPGNKDGLFIINPISDMADGKMEILLIPRTTRAGLINMLRAMAKSAAQSLPGVWHFQTRRIEVTLGKKMTLIVDGDAIPPSDKYVFDFDPAPIRLLAPKGSRPGSRKLSSPT